MDLTFTSRPQAFPGRAGASRVSSALLVGALLLVAPLASGVSAQGGAPADRPPNVLLILADDMTYHDLGSYGNPDVRTPNLDRLAGEGLRFEYAFNSAPMCAPTRMSLYTGIHPVRNGGYPNHSRVYDHIRSMPHYLEPLGYRVAIVGKRHEAPDANFPFEYLGGRHHDDGGGVDVDLDRVREFMRDTTDRPWLLVVASNQPHMPWTRGDASEYDAAKLKLPPYLVDTQETREAMTRYYAEITYLDDQVGQVLRFLRESGQADGTLVIFLSEQGSNFPFAKWTAYDAGLRSAALVRWPGVVRPGTVTEAMIQYVDVLPTIIEVAGGDPGGYGFDGMSFLPVLTGDRGEHHAHVFGVQTSKGIYAGPDAYGIRTVRDRRYRLIWNLNWEGEFRNTVTASFAPYQSWIRKAEGGDSHARRRVDAYVRRPEFELYDLEADPYELNNIAGEAVQEPRLRAMKARLAEWMRQQGDLGKLTEAMAPTRQP